MFEGPAGLDMKYQTCFTVLLLGAYVQLHL